MKCFVLQGQMLVPMTIPSGFRGTGLADFMASVTCPSRYHAISRVHSAGDRKMEVRMQSLPEGLRAPSVHGEGRRDEGRNEIQRQAVPKSWAVGGSGMRLEASRHMRTRPHAPALTPADNPSTRVAIRRAHRARRCGAAARGHAGTPRAARPRRHHPRMTHQAEEFARHGLGSRDSEGSEARPARPRLRADS
jgi:hypothetical protein